MKGNGQDRRRILICVPKGRRGYYPRPPIQERLWSRVARGGPDECWLWNGSRCGKPWPGAAGGQGGRPYGALRYMGRAEKAHRVSWILRHGPIPAGQQVLHRCDHTLCVNPAHLFLGTQKDNVADMEAKHRSRHPRRLGGLNGMARLRVNEAHAIRMLAQHTVQRELAALYGISQASVSRILCGKSWNAPCA